MAHVQSTAAHGGNFFSGFFEGIFNFLVRISEANSRVKEIERLNSMSDAQLKKLGMERTDIVRHVFRDSFYV
ncbi:DUF1127 domain-containing protein [Mameliella sp. CS4]|uniref:DUF1127 domain-containing protein n=1 Tax=Mameliella sp. CS4 TaxID=2862329 RepID=UPI001C60273D|nr:DUF1127 domain-containing protein [Mameliella sp. CS4]MBW4982829.1 DUF1127 domain-containing protein [Mameliella sp. CS4]